MPNANETQNKMHTKQKQEYQLSGSNEGIAFCFTNTNAKLKSNHLKMSKVGFFFNMTPEENTEKANFKKWLSAFLLLFSIARYKKKLQNVIQTN